MDMEFRESFTAKVKKADEYEKKINDIWSNYDDKANIIFLTNLRMELCIAAYKYLGYLENIVADHQTEAKIQNLKTYTTMFSYILATSSLFIAPEVSLPSFMGAIFLSVKKRFDNMKENEEFLYAEECELINDKLENFGNEFSQKLKTLEDKISTLTNVDEINSLEEPTKSNRIAGKLLVDIFDCSLDNKKFSVEAPDNIKDEIKKIIKENYNFESQNTEELIAMAISDYLDKADTLYDIQESTRKRLHKTKRTYYK